MILYIHGFRSSSNSIKFKIIKNALKKKIGDHVFCPDLSHDPNLVVNFLVNFINKNIVRRIIASSLGGYYCLWLVKKFKIKSLIINPAINPFVDLKKHVGIQSKFYTGEKFNFTQKNLIDLRKYKLEEISSPELISLIQTTGDEILNWKIAKKKFKASRQIIIHGSNHGFDDFEKYTNLVVNFCLEN